MNQRLSKTLPSRFVLAVTVGGVIGLGILRGPGEIAHTIHSPSLYLLLWFCGGIFVLLSTAVTAELFGMTARSGGTYALVRRAYGGYSGFVIGWVDWLSFTADLALKAVVITEFSAILYPPLAHWSTPLAIIVTSSFALIQLRGISVGARIQEIATSIISLVIVSMTVILFFIEIPESNSIVLPATDGGLVDWSLVVATIVFTYDGWLYAAYFGEEIKGNPSVSARSCIKGMVIVISLYMLLNLALVTSTGLAALAGSELAIAKAFELAKLPLAENLVVIAAILILLGHQNLEYMSGPRILYALAVDGLAARGAQKLGHSGNPTFALMATWIVTVGLISVGGFEFLLFLSVFFYISIYLALIVGVIILRRREPTAERPYEAWGHPYSTGACLLGWVILTSFQAYVERDTAIYAVIMAAVSWPVFRYLSGDP